MKLFGIFLVLAFSVCVSPLKAVDSIALIYGNKLAQMKTVETERLRNSKVDYLAVQLVLGKTDKAMIDKLRYIAKDKKIMLQIWWGPGGKFNWSYYSLPGLAYESEVRENFFAAVDHLIREIGEDMIYGIHLLEECMYFGVDTDQSGDWRKNKEHLADGYEDGIAYNNNTPPAWSPLRPNVRRYQQLMLKETGVDMALHSIWTLEQKYVFQRWCENTSARAELEFFKHIKSRYPSIKTFSWYYPPSYGYTFSNWALYGQYVDGFINDPYNSLNTTFHFYRQFKTLYPDKLLCIIIHGNFVKREVRTGRLTNAYLSGADIIGFFEGVIEPVFGTELVSDIDKTAYPFPENSKTEAMDWESETTWRLNCDLFAEIKNLPPFNMKAPFLLVSGNFDRSAQASIHHYSSLFFFDNLTAGSVFMVEDFSRYDMIVTHQCPFIDNKKFMNKYHVDGFGIDKEKILDYVAKGGILALFDRKLPEFLQEYIGENNFVTETIIHDKSEVFISTSKPFVKQHAEEFFRGILVKHGKGLIFYSGFVDGINSLDYRKVLSYERYTADVLRALLERGGKKELADKFINPAGHECNYRLIKDIHGSYFYRFFRKDSKPSAILVEGEDILRSGSNLGSIYMKRKVIK